MNKRHKLVSVKLLRKSSDAFIGFSVKGILDGQSTIFTGIMTITEDMEAFISFDDESIDSLDEWYDQCGEKLHDEIFVKLKKNIHKYL